MWYSLIPRITVIACAVGFPTVFQYYVNWIVRGNSFRRDLGEPFELWQYQRDFRWTNGHPYESQGLEFLADEK